MCSITLGPAICPSLVTWPTSSSALPAFLAWRISACAAARTWLTVPGAASIASAHSVWMESTTIEIGRRSGFERRQDMRQARFAGERDRRIRQAEALGAQAHLRRRFLAGEIDGAPAGASQRRRELQQQRRFADAGLAADEQRRARHDAAAGDAVQFADAGREARRLLRRRP